MRESILETVINALQPLEFVLALWQGGSAAHGYTDEGSIPILQEGKRMGHIFAIIARE